VRVEQARGSGIVEGRQGQLRQARVGEGMFGPLSAGGQQDDRVGLQAPRDEGQHVGGAAVQPVRVFDDQDQRGARRVLREQVEHRQRDAEQLRGRRVAQAEGDRQCFTVGLRQPVRRREDRSQELVEGREGHGGLGLHTRGPEHPDAAFRRASLRGGQQRRLPHAGFADHDQGPAPLRCTVDEIVECRDLQGAPEEFSTSRHHARSPSSIPGIHSRRSHGMCPKKNREQLPPTPPRSIRSGTVVGSSFDMAQGVRRGRSLAVSKFAWVGRPRLEAGERGATGPSRILGRIRPHRSDHRKMSGRIRRTTEGNPISVVDR
jgi:hypothetical protein